MDQMVRTSSTKQVTRRWPMVLFYDLENISAVNAFAIWSALDEDEQHKERRKFLVARGKELADVAVNVAVEDAVVNAAAEPPAKKG